MKCALILPVMLFSAAVAFGQEEVYFDYVSYGKDITMVIPLFEEPLDHDRPVEKFIVQDEKKVEKYLDSLLVQCFTPEELRRLGVDHHTAASSVLVYADATGKISYIQFILRGNDKLIATDRKLYRLYQLLKESGIDPAWGRLAVPVSEPEICMAVGFKMFRKSE
ncbi:MAG: hypothetical protein LBR65_01025 [Culturomica sp.]|nr:hypothetical protein [Culturomica sp.]